MFRLASCHFVCIVIVIAFSMSRFWTIDSLEYFNPPVFLKLFLENSICMQQSKDPNKKSNLIFGRRNSKTIKLATLNISSSFTLKMFTMYFWDHPLKCEYRESYDIKCDWYSLKPTYHIKTSHVIYNEN